MFPFFLRLLALALLASPLLAHDRHANAAMHQDVLVRIGKDSIEVSFQIETNDEGTLIEAIAMDSDADGKLSPAEQSAYFAQLDARLREGFQIEVDGIDVPLATSKEVILTPPARKTFRFLGDLPPHLPAAASLQIHNNNFVDRPGRAVLKVEAVDGIAVTVEHNSGTAADGFIVSGPDALFVRTTELTDFDTWSKWSWRNVVFSRWSAAVLSAAVLATTLLLVFRDRLSRADRITGLALITVGLITGFLFLLTRNPTPYTTRIWAEEFRRSHVALLFALVSYHQGTPSTEVPFSCSAAFKNKLLSTTRVLSEGDEKSGTFELLRVRHLSTTVLETPRSIIIPTLRVHHEWRAIGVVRHQGHPHERVRDFACDYTLRATEHGLQMMDCSEWHQLPDEPVE